MKKALFTLVLILLAPFGYSAPLILTQELDDFLSTPSSANLALAITGETGSGALVFGTGPTLAAPVFSGTITGTFTIGGTPTFPGSVTLDTEWDTEAEVQTAWGSVNILLETEIDASSELAALMDDETGSGALVFGTSPTITTPTISGAIAFPDGTRQTFNPNGTTPGLNVGSHTADPSGPSNGDLWYDSSNNLLRARVNGATISITGSAGGLASGDIDTSAELASIVGDETGSGALVFGSSPTIASPTFSGTIAGTYTIGGTPTFPGGVTLDSEWDTIGEIETATGGINILLETEIDASSELAALMDDETGSGALVFGSSPTIASPTFSGTIAGTYTIGGTPTFPGSVTLDAEWDTEAEVQTAWGSVNILLETEIDASSELAGLMDDETGSGSLVFGTSPTITTPTISGAIAFPDGTRQTFNPNGTTPGLNVGSHTADPSGPSNGDLWYDSSNNLLRARVNGATISITGSAGGLASSDIDTSAELAGILTDETGDGGGFVRASNPTLSGATLEGTTTADEIEATTVLFTGDILDANSNELIDFTATASAVNQVAITNAAASNNPLISATGGDTDIGLSFGVKAAGKFRFLATSSGAAEIRLLEDSDNGSNYIGLVAPASVSSDASFTLPASLTSGGVMYFSSTSVMASSAALAANAIVLGGGAGAAPATTTTGTGVVSALGNTTNATGGFLTTDGTASPTNKTFDAAATGNVLKAKGYIYLTHPHLADGTNATINTTATAITYGHATFSNSVDQASNYVEYYIQVPEDLDTSVALRARLKVLLGNTDTATQRYVLSSVSVADSAVPTSSTLANAINVDFAGDGSGASGDVETSAWTTLTSWNGALTAGQTWRIRLARDGDTSDASTVNSTELGLVIEYGLTQ